MKIQNPYFYKPDPVDINDFQLSLVMLLFERECIVPLCLFFRRHCEDVI